MVDNSSKIDLLNNNGKWQKVIPEAKNVIQGPLARMSFAQQLKDKWGATYCLYTDGVLVDNRKKGTVTFKVGNNKENHSYSVQFLDKNGLMETYLDMDSAPETVTINIDTTGYAFMLIDNTQKAKERVEREYIVAKEEAISEGLLNVLIASSSVSEPVITQNLESAVRNADGSLKFDAFNQRNYEVFYSEPGNETTNWGCYMTSVAFVISRMGYDTSPVDVFNWNGESAMLTLVLCQDLA